MARHCLQNIVVAEVVIVNCSFVRNVNSVSLFYELRYRIACEGLIR